ncbi:MAG: hypothetical protein WBE34_07230 [Candidatus Nitrosopolaris sp.]
MTGEFWKNCGHSVSLHKLVPVTTAKANAMMNISANCAEEARHAMVIIASCILYTTYEWTEKQKSKIMNKQEK